MFEGINEVRRELAAASPEVDDHAHGVVRQGQQGTRERRARRAVRGRREVGGGTAARDVETAPGGIQRLVPRVAPGNGIHASGL